MGAMMAKRVADVTGYEWGFAMIDERVNAALDRELREQADAEAKQADCEALATAVVARLQTAGDLRALAVATKPETEKKPPAPITGFVSYRHVMEAVGCSKSAAYRHVREAAGRPNGTGKTLRVSVDVWERYARRTFGR
jgi:hypothetical protein